MSFTLAPELVRDTVPLGRLKLSLVLLMNDATYPWIILVPERAEVREIYQLDPSDQHQLIQESSLVARALTSAFRPDKINIAALGNMVPQLHMHHIARFKGDSAWPHPVWGRSPPRPYSD